MGFGLERLPAALVLTFDNLGEASELERGAWPDRAPLGHHRSVTEALPRLLNELESYALSATFFVEAINREDGRAGSGKVVCILRRQHQSQPAGRDHSRR